VCAALSPDTVAVCQLESQNGCGDDDKCVEWHVIEPRTRLSRGERDDLQPPPTTMTLGAIVNDPSELFVVERKTEDAEDDGETEVRQKGSRSLLKRRSREDWNAPG